MTTPKKKSPRHKKEQLKFTIGRLHTCLKTMIKNNEGPYKNKAQLAAELGRRLDLEPSIFRKSSSEHRKVLNQYLHLIIPAIPKVVEDTNIEIMRLQSLVTEQKRKIKILEQLLNESSQKTPAPPKITHIDNYYFEYESTCLMIRDIVDKNPNLFFKSGVLYDNATFSGDPELISERKNVESYLRWKDGRNTGNKRIEEFATDEFQGENSS